MKTRPLTVEIPEPDEQGNYCNAKCSLCNTRFKCKYSQVSNLVVGHLLQKPGKDCPWYEGDKDALC